MRYISPEKPSVAQEFLLGHHLGYQSAATAIWKLEDSIVDMVCGTSGHDELFI